MEILKWLSNVLRECATVGLLVVAILTAKYGYEEYKIYKSEKIPHVYLIAVDIGSNLSRQYRIFHPKLKKDMPSVKFLSENRELQEQVEEIIVELRFKNTGPIAAKNIGIKRVVYRGDQYAIDGEENKKTEVNDEINFEELLTNPKEDLLVLDAGVANLITLQPEEETTEFILLNLKKLDEQNIMKSDSSTTNYLYFICKITYDSINGSRFGYFVVYKLSLQPAYTRIYHAKKLRSYFLPHSKINVPLQ